MLNESHVKVFKRAKEVNFASLRADISESNGQNSLEFGSSNFIFDQL